MTILEVIMCFLLAKEVGAVIYAALSMLKQANDFNRLKIKASEDVISAINKLKESAKNE